MGSLNTRSASERVNAVFKQSPTLTMSYVIEAIMNDPEALEEAKGFNGSDGSVEGARFQVEMQVEHVFFVPHDHRMIEPVRGDGDMDLSELWGAEDLDLIRDCLHPIAWVLKRDNLPVVEGVDFSQGRIHTIRPSMKKIRLNHCGPSCAAIGLAYLLCAILGCDTAPGKSNISPVQPIPPGLIGELRFDGKILRGPVPPALARQMMNVSLVTGDKERRKREKDAAAGLTLRDYKRIGKIVHLRVTGEAEIRFASKNKEYCINRLAVGDADGDGLQDGLISVGAYYRGGSGRNYTSYRLSRTNASQRSISVRPHAALLDQRVSIPPMN